MNNPPNNHSQLWSDLPFNERARLMPHALESQLLHIWQCKQKAVSAHKTHMKELNEWMSDIERELGKYK